MIFFSMGQEKNNGLTLLVSCSFSVSGTLTFVSLYRVTEGTAIQPKTTKQTRPATPGVNMLPRNNY